MELTVRPLIVTATLADQAYELLLRDISTGLYLPGHPLRELDLVARLGISRTPIREALVRMTATGLVEADGRSLRVRRLTAADLVHIYQVRRGLEGEAIRIACGRFTPDDFAHLDALAPAEADLGTPAFADAAPRFDRALHRLIAERSGNPLLTRELVKLHDLLRIVQKPVVARTGQLARELREHEAIVAALRAGDRRAARQALFVHLRAACRMLVRCQTADGRPRAVAP